MAVKPVPAEPLSDGVVLVRRLVDSDVPYLVRASQDAGIQRWNPIAATKTEGAARDWVAGRALDREPPGDRYSFAVAAVEDPEAVLGAIGVFRVENSCGDIGYWSAPWARGRGVAPRAVRLVARWALTELGLMRVQMTIDTENAASLRAAEKAGFRREGVLRNVTEHEGTWRDDVIFSVVPGEL